jgi:pantoate--beta-alanine ligase
MMEVVNTIAVMQEECESLRLSGKRIALVPTMGFFHEGHLELMRRGRELSDIVVVSIFVNPTQFGPHEDFDSYPRDMESDLAKAEEQNVEYIFSPSVDEMYPGGTQTKIIVEKVTKYLCGLSRPGHFDGVTTVVAKLFNIAKPHIAIFGEKDYQQLTVIRRMAKDLDMDIRIVGVPTVREPDGLAMSSRNSYLSTDERLSALSLNKSLDLAEDLCKQGEREVFKIRKAVERFILTHPRTAIDYISICDPHTLEDLEVLDNEALVALAVKVGKTRLIDNRVITTS